MLRKSNILFELSALWEINSGKDTLNFKGDQTAVRNNQIKPFGLFIFSGMLKGAGNDFDLKHSKPNHLHNYC